MQAPLWRALDAGAGAGRPDPQVEPGVRRPVHLAAAWQTDQPMHSQSANFGKFKLNSLNLAAFCSLHPVQD